MTRQALAGGATFILWPESSTPFLFEQDITSGGAVRRLAHEGQATAARRQRSGRAGQGHGTGEKPADRATTTPRFW